MLAFQARALAACALRKWEGLRLEPYRDIAGVLTVGYGHTGGDARKLSRMEAEALLLSDVRRIERGIDWRGLEALKTHQRAAIICFAFNVGAAAFNKSTLRAVIAHGLRIGDPQEATIIKEWMRWVHAGGLVSKGLVRRRAQELELFRGVEDMEKIKATIITWVLERLAERSTAAGLGALAVAGGVSLAPDVATFLATTIGALLVLVKTRLN